MSLLFIDGFTHYATNDLSKKWDDAYTLWSRFTIGSPGRRTNTKHLTLWNNAANYVQKGLVIGEDIVIVGFASYIPEGCYNHGGFRIGNILGDQCTVRVESDGSITVRRGSYTGAILGQSNAGVLTTNKWYYIEFKIKVHNSAGTYEVRVNGVPVTNGSGVDTQFQASDGITFFRLHGYYSVTYLHRITDLYIADTAGGKNNDFLGDCRVDVIMPSGDGNYSEWDVLVGPSNYQDVDDPGDIDDDATYVYTGVGAEKDSYAFENLATIGKPILAVQSCLCTKKDDAGNRRIKHLARISAANYLSGKQTIGDNYVVKRKIWEDSPATASAWTESEINGAEFGVQLVTTTSTTSTTSTTTTV